MSEPHAEAAPLNELDHLRNLIPGARTLKARPFTAGSRRIILVPGSCRGGRVRREEDPPHCKHTQHDFTN